MYVYDDVPWLPYAESDGASSLNCSWVVAHRFASGGDDAASGRELASTLESLDDDAVERMRTCAKAHATTHFGKSGVIGEIASFLSGGERASSLRCAPLPEDSGTPSDRALTGKIDTQATGGGALLFSRPSSWTLKSVPPAARDEGAMA